MKKWCPAAALQKPKLLFKTHNRCKQWLHTNTHTCTHTYEYAPLHFLISVDSHLVKSSSSSSSSAPPWPEERSTRFLNSIKKGSSPLHGRCQRVHLVPFHTIQLGCHLVQVVTERNTQQSLAFYICGKRNKNKNVFTLFGLCNKICYYINKLKGCGTKLEQMKGSYCSRLFCLSFLISYFWEILKLENIHNIYTTVRSSCHFSSLG